MSNIRLFHPENIIENTTCLLSKEHTHYVVNVMRLKRGSNLNLFNKDGEWLCEIIFINKDSFKPSNIEIAICLVKKGPMDNILQKATELGVHKIIPILSERTEVKELNLERAKKITIGASEQSNQLFPPEISKVTNLKDFLKNLDSSTKLLFADVNSKNNLKKGILKEANFFSVLIGPEGDFSPNERELINSKSNTYSFSLSKNILRTDTAVISAISLVKFVLNEH